MAFIVAVTQPHREAKVADRMRDDGCEVFFPQEKRLVVSRGRRHVRMTPLFPRYVMVKQPCELSNTRDVVDVIMTSDNKPATIFDEVIEQLRSWLVDDVYYEKKKKIRGFIQGERVTPKAGPLQWHVGTVEQALPHHRVAALFVLFGREVSVRFKISDLVAA